MTEFYIIAIIVLGLLAITDLMFGVANDAVNFLNSGIGSRAASRRTLMIIAGFGIFTGVFFASGMMEVARKGFFQPDKFLLFDVMTIFLAVMFTDILLLDLFNTFGLPTSTTVSLVSAFIGSSIAVAAIKIFSTGGTLDQLGNYLNVGSAVSIVSGIFISVLVALPVGILLQYITRLIFSFDYQKNLKKYGAIWGGIAFTLISFFILIKGMKSAKFIDPSVIGWVNDNVGMLMLISSVVWFLIFLFLQFATKINILKVIVLFGTFALALSFAANDLVNFIGAPIAGYTAFTIGSAGGFSDTMTMGELASSDAAPPWYFLILAGIIMTGTLFVSKKANTVTKTEVNLGRQTEGFERFDSSTVSRGLVRMGISIVEGLKKVLPDSAIAKINTRFVSLPHTGTEERGEFDLLRAAVNLVVASSLISLGTSLKLPLSTTYVTFIVAMGTSLADRAWGRESAVYRVNGVLTVISGWFITAIIAIIVSMTFATFIHFTSLVAVFVLVAASGYFIYHTTVLHRRREAQENKSRAGVASESESKESSDLVIHKELAQRIEDFTGIVKTAMNGFMEEKRKVTKNAYSDAKNAKEELLPIFNSLVNSLQFLNESDLNKSFRYGRLMSCLEETAEKTLSIAKKAFSHLDNNHHAPAKETSAELKKLLDIYCKKAEIVIQAVRDDKFELAQIRDLDKEFVKAAKKLENEQFLKIKKRVQGFKTHMLTVRLISDLEDISDRYTEIAVELHSNGATPPATLQ